MKNNTTEVNTKEPESIKAKLKAFLMSIDLKEALLETFEEKSFAELNKVKDESKTPHSS